MFADLKIHLKQCCIQESHIKKYMESCRENQNRPEGLREFMERSNNVAKR